MEKRIKKRKRDKKRNKKAQLTIFIILAIMIVAVLLILFYPRIKVLVAGEPPTEYIEQCAKEATEEALEKILLQGGSLEPENYILYQDSKVEYVCYTNEYYKKCTMQKPFLKQDIEKEIITYIEPKVKNCFESLKQQLERSGSSVKIQDINTDVTIVQNSIIVTINAPTTITKEGASSFNKFKTDIKSELYDLTMLASSISNYEAKYGDSDTLTYMLYYPDIRVEKKVQSDGSKIYILTYKPTEEKLMFATRSIAWPVGYGGE